MDNPTLQQQLIVAEELAEGTHIILPHFSKPTHSQTVGANAGNTEGHEYGTKNHGNGNCMKCGQPANYTHRTFESEERVAVGGTCMYEARCRQCFAPHADAPTAHDE